MATITMDSNRPTVVGNVIMVSGDVSSDGFGLNTFDASPYMNEIISAHVLCAGQINPVISNNDAPTDANFGFTVNLPALSCTFSGTTLTFTSRNLVTEIASEGAPAFIVNAQAAVCMGETATLPSNGKFLIIGRK